MGSTERIWNSAKGPLRISEMDSSHIVNCIEKIKRGEVSKQASALSWFMDELARRGSSDPQNIIPYSDYKTKIFTNKFIDENSDKIDWDLLVTFQELTGYILEKYKEKLNWDKVYQFQVLPYEYILHHSSTLRWRKMAKNLKYDEEFLEMWAEFISWPIVAKHRKFSPYLIDRFYKLITLDVLCSYQDLTEKFIRDHLSEFSAENWYFISYRVSGLSISFLQEFKEKLNWKIVSENSDLSLGVLETFKEDIDWNKVVTCNKNITPEIIFKYRDHIDFSIACLRLRPAFGAKTGNKNPITGLEFSSGRNTVIYDLDHWD